MVENVRMTKILMDGGSGINILCKDALEKLSIDASKLRASQSLFHGIVLGWRVMPLGTIVLLVMFGNWVHYQKETLSFEVVDFEGPYHTIFGRPCYAKFMAVPNYAYLKLKVTGPCGVITISGNFRDAYECEREAIK
ncbi:uncharacterized protein [Miscanthus floridulus]|uniref:uncharacterized protein n=1 Tax=Miscanthus floridulus TaxID=154761 RepID=UPI00345962B7